MFHKDLKGKRWTAEDDAASVGGRGMRTRRVWQEKKGCIFVLNHLGSEGSNAHLLEIEDITVVYVYTRFRLFHGNEHRVVEVTIFLLRISL